MDDHSPYPLKEAIKKKYTEHYKILNYFMY